MKRLLQGCMLLLMLLLATRNYAQVRTITGTVISNDDRQALSGVSVLVQGSSAGTATNASGRFSINASTGQVLVFSSVGYQTKEVVVGNENNIAVRLDLSPDNLKAVVVIGYGTARKKQMVGSSSVVSTKDVGANTATNTAQLLIGKASGVQVVNSNGIPGSSSQIIIRGTGSFTSVDPLYVIDGMQTTANIFNSIAPQDIENITILKDASSTAIYGAAAANGVVIVTTKKIRSGVPRISVTSQFGTSQAWKLLDLLNAREYVDLMKDYAAAKGVALPAKLNSPDVLVDKTDWQREMFRNASSSQTDVNINGGSDKVLYNLSLGYITQESILKDYNYKKINARFSLDETFGRFHFGQSLTIRHTKSTGQNIGLFIDGVTAYPSYQPIYDSTILGGYSIVSNLNDLASSRNPRQAIDLFTRKGSEYVLFPQLFGEVTLIKGLSIRSQIAATYGGGSSSSFQKAYTASNFLNRDRQAQLGLNNYFTYTFENYLSYNKVIGKHNISGTVGTSYIDAGYSNNLTETGSNIPNNNIQNTNVSLLRSIGTSSESYGTQVGRTKSVYGRLIYSYNDRYVLSGSIRRDGSSNFGSHYRYGNFPAAGFAWNFSEEDFIKKRLPFISEGKLRMGWGRTGNNRFPMGLTDVFVYSGTPSGTLIYSFGPNESFVPGTTVSTISNPYLKWEETDQTDVGIDLGFLNNRLTFTLDWYDRKSSGLLVRVPLPASTGILGVARLGNPNILTNAADAENKGLELSVGYRSTVNRNFSYNINVNGSYNKNTTLSLSSGTQVPIKDGSVVQGGTITITQQGFPIGSFFGYRVDHVAKDQAEIDALNAAAVAKTGDPSTKYQTGLVQGDFIYKDLNGDGVLNSKDQEVLGNPIPKYMYGINIGANYKKFDFNLVASGLAGLKLINATKYYTQMVIEAHNATTAILNRWRKPGDVAALPRAGQNASNLRASDFYLENGSYLRLRNVTLGYTFSKSTLQNFTGNIFNNVRLYVAAQNLFTITDYSGYDPEISTQSSNDGDSYIFRRGIDNGQLPQPRTFIAGIQLQF